MDPIIQQTDPTPASSSLDLLTQEITDAKFRLKVLVEMRDKIAKLHEADKSAP